MAQNDSLILRSLRADDQAALEEVVGRVWAYDRFCSPRTARSLTALGLQSSLYQSTFGQVAEVEGQVVGVILGRCGTVHRPVWPVLRGLLRLLSCAEGRRVCRIARQLGQLSSQMLQSADRRFDAELVLLAVTPELQGRGIGLQLWKAAEAYFRKAGGTRLYLCTDSQCNYGFYDRHGFSRLDMCQSALPQALGGERMEFYLYEKDLAV
ncbi:MAG: GNAT family N-acetyltransferase [Clostridiales bacterium]|nr:GNAT family N-acetyltransferase [Clostridiales bacterium]